VRVVLYAVSSPYAADALETVERLGWQVAACVRNVSEVEPPPEVVDAIDADALTDDLRSLPFAVALVSPGHRRVAHADARARGMCELVSLFDPTAIIARSACFGEGAYINAGAIVAAVVRAGVGCGLNRGASIGHHCAIGDYVSFGPGAVTGGSCRFGDGAFVGAGAVIAPQVTVGTDAVVGAGAVVVSDVPERAVVVGNPARVLHYGDGYGDAGSAGASVSA
jgi:sugar O-acyltransferase (sialic acid O-acetyltransferase NeuD family)